MLTRRRAKACSAESWVSGLVRSPCSRAGRGAGVAACGFAFVSWRTLDSVPLVVPSPGPRRRNPLSNVTNARNLSDAASSRFAKRRIVSSSQPAEASGSPEHYGDPQGEYERATSGCAMVRRADRGLLRVWGRAPRQMLNGMLTNRLPDAPREAAGVVEGERTYGTILTRKARIVSDVRAFWLGRSEEGGLGLDLAMVAWDGVLRHFATYLPPRMAKVEDLSGRIDLLTVVGDQARQMLQTVFGRVPRERRYWLIDGGPMEGGAVVAGGLEQTPSWDVWAGGEEMDRIVGRLEKKGAAWAGSRGVGDVACRGGVSGSGRGHGRNGHSDRGRTRTPSLRSRQGLLHRAGSRDQTSPQGSRQLAVASVAVRAFQTRAERRPVHGSGRKGGRAGHVLRSLAQVRRMDRNGLCPARGDPARNVAPRKRRRSGSFDCIIAGGAGIAARGKSPYTPRAPRKAFRHGLLTMTLMIPPPPPPQS